LALDGWWSDLGDGGLKATRRFRDYLKMLLLLVEYTYTFLVVSPKHNRYLVAYIIAAMYNMRESSHFECVNVVSLRTQATESDYM